MRTNIVLIVCTAIILCNMPVIGQDISNVEKKPPTKNDILKQYYLLQNQINDKSIPIEQVLPKFKKLEDTTKENLPLYLEVADGIVRRLQSRYEDEDATSLGKAIIAQAAFVSLDDGTLNPAERTEALERQLRMLLTYRYRPRKMKILNDCDPKLRKKNADRLTELYCMIASRIEEGYDSNASENLFVVDGFMPPASHQGHYSPGMDMSNDNDKATREAYKKYKEEETAKLQKGAVQSKARSVRDHSTKQVQDYLIDAYSLFPYRTDELEKMLAEHKVDAEMTKTILDAVKKNEKEHPDFGGRRWLSTDKLFMVDAKFISLDNGVVTLEKADGKRTTIELDALRDIDRKFIDEQLKEKKP